MKIRQELPTLAYRLKIYDASDYDYLAILRYSTIDDNFFIVRESDDVDIICTTSKKTYDGLCDYINMYQNQVGKLTYKAVLKEVPDENSSYYAITASIPIEINKKLLDLYLNRKGFVCYNWTLPRSEDIGDLSMTLTDQNLVFDISQTLKSFGVDVSNINEEMSKYLKDCIDNKWNGGSN